MNRKPANGKPVGLSIVYINGEAKLFNSVGEEITEVINLILYNSIDSYNTVDIKAICNVYSTVDEMMADVKKEQLFSIQEGDVKITINRSKI